MRSLPLLLLLGCVSPLYAQSVSPGASILQAAVAKAGWSVASRPQDVTAKGTAIEADGRSVALTIEAKGDKLRIARPDFVFTFDGFKAGRRDSSATTTRSVPFHVAWDASSFIFPFYSPLAYVGDPTLSVGAPESASSRGVPCTRISVARSYEGEGGISVLKQRSSQVQVCISSETGLPLQLEFDLFAMEGPSASLHTTAYYSDYRQVAGISLPFKIEEFAEGRLVQTITWDSMQFNQGLKDSDFATTGVAQ